MGGTRFQLARRRGEAWSAPLREPCQSNEYKVPPRGNGNKTTDMEIYISNNQWQVWWAIFLIPGNFEVPCWVLTQMKIYSTLEQPPEILKLPSCAKRRSKLDSMSTESSCFSVGEIGMCWRGRLAKQGVVFFIHRKKNTVKKEIVSTYG